MHNKMIKSVSLILISIACLFATDWDFPIKPGTEAWKVSSPQEATARLQKLQIPADKIEMLSTMRLVELCYTYPFMADMYLFSSVGEAFSMQQNRFNGFKELVRRDDLAAATMQKVSELLSVGYSQEASERLIQKQFVLLLSDYDVLLALSKKNRTTIIELLYNCVAGSDLTNLEAMVIARCMEIDQTGLFSKSRSAGTTVDTDAVLTGAAYDTDPALAELKTLSGDYGVAEYSPAPRTAIPDNLGGFNWKLEMQAIAKARLYPNALLVGRATKDYNCWNYAYEQPFEGDISKYQKLDLTDITLLLEGDMYREVSSDSAMCAEYPGGLPYRTAKNMVSYYEAIYQQYFHGAKIIKWNPTESDIRNQYVGSMFEGEPYFRSKWGDFFLMEHSWFDCPYFDGYIYLADQPNFDLMVEGNVLEGATDLPSGFVYKVAPSVRKYYQTPDNVLYVEMDDGERRIYNGKPENKIPFTKEHFYLTVRRVPWETKKKVYKDKFYPIFTD